MSTTEGAQAQDGQGNDEDSLIDVPYEIRITSHGKIRAWVKFGLSFLQENPGRPLVLHTLPHKAMEEKQLQADVKLKQPSDNQEVPDNTMNEVEDARDEMNGSETAIEEDGESKEDGTIFGHRVKRRRMHPATTVIPRLISVTEILKREYTMAEMQRLYGKPWPDSGEEPLARGLEQWNEVGCLEDLAEWSPPLPEAHDLNNAAEEDRPDQIIRLLSGRRFTKIQRTPYMKITLCTRKLQNMGNATYQSPPPPKRLPKQARRRARYRAARPNNLPGNQKKVISTDK